MTLRYVHWQDGSDFIGHLVDYPDYLTQGTSEDDLKAHLIDLYRDLNSGELPYASQLGDRPQMKAAASLRAYSTHETSTIATRKCSIP